MSSQTNYDQTLEGHVIECGARYNILNDTVKKQGKQMDKIEDLIVRIDDKLDSHIDALNKKIDDNISKTNDRIDDVEKNASSNIYQILIGLVLGLAGFVGALIFSSLVSH
jgi:wobble nucleotide-excising tRNase